MLDEESYRQLKEFLDSCDRAYYVQGTPLISDVEYDKRKKELEAYQTEHGIQPTVSTDLTKESKRVKHPVRMLSLANTYNMDDVRTFMERVTKHLVEDGCADAVQTTTLCLEPKIDGLSIEVYYDETGAYCRALTRGDGEYGEDVTENVRTIECIPKTMPYGPVIVRGEVYMARSRLEALKEQGVAPKDANCRNFAVGSLKQKDPAVTKERGLEALFYDIVTAPCLDHIDTQDTLLSVLSVNLKLPTQDWHSVVPLCHPNWVEGQIAILKSGREKYDYDTDGMVLKVNELRYRSHLGCTEKYPRWAFAYKYNPEEAVSRVKSIDFQVGRTGRITPVVNIEPVKLSGATVSRISTGSVGTLKKLGLNVDMDVTVVRSGEVVPKILGVVLQRGHGPFEVDSFLQTCPVCGTPTTRGAGGEEYFCPNPSCPPKLTARLLHFCSREAGLDIEGVGNTVADVLVKTGVVRHFTDILTIPLETLASVTNPENGRILGKAAEKIVATRNLREKPFWRILSSLGIEGLGIAASKAIANRYTSLDDFIKRNTILDTTEDGFEELSLAQWLCSDEGEFVSEKIRNLLN